MSLACRHCRRLNPVDAAYCHYDGVCLLSHAESAGPLDLAQQPFPHPFDFPDGTRCQNFDQLALVCQAQPTLAMELIRSNTLQAFFAGLGRMDLVMATGKIRDQENLDLAIDGLLERLPTRQITASRLNVDIKEKDLGPLQAGQKAAFQIRLSNEGKRLLYGTITSDGEGVSIDRGQAGQPRHFQFWNEQVFTIILDAEKAGASLATRKVRLGIESNAGADVIPITYSRPITPFARAPLQGSRTPRELAAKAKKSPREAADLLHQGEVQAWYAANGWIFPIQGRLAPGLAVVQQYFETLGLVKPTSVVLDTPALTCSGPAGSHQVHIIELHTEEKRPLYAFARSSSPHLSVVDTATHGNRIRITVKAIIPPHATGVDHDTHIDIQSNGPQRFRVPALLHSEDDGYSEQRPLVRRRQRSSASCLARALAVVAFGLLLFMLIAAGGVYYYLHPPEFAHPNPLKPFTEAIVPETYLVAFVDIAAQRRAENLAAEFKPLEDQLVERIRDLDVQPKNATIQSIFLACAAKRPMVSVWTFSEPVQFGTVHPGRYEQREQDKLVLSTDRATPDLSWAVDGTGRIVSGSPDDVTRVILRGKQHKADETIQRLVRPLQFLPAEPLAWASATFHKVPSTEAIPRLAQELAQPKIESFMVAVRQDRNRGLVGQVRGRFPSALDAAFGREFLRAAPEGIFAGLPSGFDEELLLHVADWNPIENELTTELMLVPDLKAQLWRSTSDRLTECQMAARKRLDTIRQAALDKGNVAMKAGEFAQAVSLFQNSMKMFPEDLVAKTSYEEARSAQDAERAYLHGLKTIQQALAEANLSQASATITDLKSSKFADNRLSALQRELGQKQTAINLGQHIKEAEALLNLEHLAEAKAKYDEAAKLAPTQADLSKMALVIAWVLQTREDLAQIDKLERAKEWSKARKGLEGVFQRLAAVADDTAWNSKKIKSNRSKVENKTARLGRAICDALLDDAKARGDEANLLAAKGDQPGSNAAFEGALQAMQQTYKLTTEIERWCGKDSSLGVLEKGQFEERQAGFRKEMDAARGKFLFAKAKQMLAKCHTEADQARRQLALIPALTSQLQEAMNSLKDAEGLGQKIIEDYRIDAEKLRVRLERMLHPVAIDIQNQKFPDSWSANKKWSFIAAPVKPWLIAPGALAQSLTTDSCEWPADFILDAEIAILSGDRIENANWAGFSDPLLLTLVNQRGASCSIALGKDPQIPNQNRIRLSCNKEAKGANWLSARQPIPLRIRCKSNQLEISLDNRLVMTQVVDSNFHQLRMQVNNPAIRGAPQFLVGIAALDVRALNADDK